jgi:hypothetical protein
MRAPRRLQPRAYQRDNGPDIPHHQFRIHAHGAPPQLRKRRIPPRVRLRAPRVIPPSTSTTSFRAGARIPPSTSTTSFRAGAAKSTT